MPLAYYVLWKLIGLDRPVMIGHVVIIAGIMWIIMEVVDLVATVIKRKNNPMSVDPEKLEHPVTQALVGALQKGDVNRWKSLFAPDAELFDDGRPRDLEAFTRDSIGHERFTSIDTEYDNGLNIIGRFHSDKWGNFVTYFRLTLNKDNKITRLDIGQALRPTRQSRSSFGL